MLEILCSLYASLAIPYNLLSITLSTLGIFIGIVIAHRQKKHEEWTRMVHYHAMNDILKALNVRAKLEHHPSTGDPTYLKELEVDPIKMNTTMRARVVVRNAAGEER